MYALRASDGTLLWSYQTGIGADGFGGVGGPPRVSNGTVFFAADDGCVYALRAADGTLIWRYQTGGRVQSSTTIDT